MAYNALQVEACFTLSSVMLFNLMNFLPSLRNCLAKAQLLALEETITLAIRGIS